MRRMFSSLSVLLAFGVLLLCSCPAPADVVEIDFSGIARTGVWDRFDPITQTASTVFFSGNAFTGTIVFNTDVGTLTASSTSIHLSGAVNSASVVIDGIGGGTLPSSQLFGDIFVENDGTHSSFAASTCCGPDEPVLGGSISTIAGALPFSLTTPFAYTTQAGDTTSGGFQFGACPGNEPCFIGSLVSMSLTNLSAVPGPTVGAGASSFTFAALFLVWLVRRRSHQAI